MILCYFVDFVFVLFFVLFVLGGGGGIVGKAIRITNPDV